MSINVHMDDISNAIPYYASKFTKNHFKRMRINLKIGEYYKLLKIDENFDEFRNIIPKHIQISG